jgi:BirA family biotin operon repressor/biotin-[acetyl-CoA-carboxylase] ligase
MVFMKILEIANPFDAPVYHVESTVSTMEAVRELSRSGAVPGTVVMAEFQERGRGRQGRSWSSEKGESLLFTLLLRYPGPAATPRGLTLRTGLSLALSLEEFAPPLRPELKWPNDIILDGKKAAGILTEGDGGDIYIGMGINVFQREFPPELKDRSVSIALALGEAWRNAASPESRLVLLEKILKGLHNELKQNSWRDRVESRLYRRGQTVAFAPGGPDSSPIIEGTLEGIGEAGELLITPAGGGEAKSFISGELRLYKR